MWMAEDFMAAARIMDGQEWQNRDGEQLCDLLEASGARKVEVQIVVDGAQCEPDRDETCYDRRCEACRPPWFDAYRFADDSGVVLVDAYWDYVSPAGRTVGVLSGDGHAGDASLYASFPGKPW